MALATSGRLSSNNPAIIAQSRVGTHPTTSALDTHPPRQGSGAGERLRGRCGNGGGHHRGQGTRVGKSRLVEGDRNALVWVHQPEVVTTIQVDECLVFDVHNHVLHAICIDVVEGQ